MTATRTVPGRDIETSDGVVLVWNPQVGHVPASPSSAAWLRVERLARRLGMASVMHAGKRRPVSSWAGLL